MARRQNTQTPVESTTDEAVETVTESTETVTPETTDEVKAPEVEADLTEFKAAVESAIEGADTSTGEVDVEALSNVNKAYREIDGIKGKNAGRTWLDEGMKHAISEEKNIVKAKSFVLIKDGLTAAGGSSTPKAPADPTQAFVQKVVAVSLARDLVLGTVPEGVNDDWTEKADALTAELAGQVEAYSAYLASDDEDAEAPEVSPVVRSAFKMAAGKATGGSSTRVSGGPRRDIVKHMEQVFDGLDSGSFLTINELAKAQSTEYGDDRPSAGAVSARLFPKGKDAYKSEVLEAVAEEGKPRGARKL